MPAVIADRAAVGYLIRVVINELIVVPTIKPCGPRGPWIPAGPASPGGPYKITHLFPFQVQIRLHVSICQLTLDHTQYIRLYCIWY